MDIKASGSAHDAPGRKPAIVGNYGWQKCEDSAEGLGFRGLGHWGWGFKVWGV